MPSCSPRSELPRRGFALMWALVIVATVLGGSALVLQRAARGSDSVKRQKLAAQLDSGVASGERLARALVAPAHREGRARVEQSVDLEGVRVTVSAQAQPEDPRRYLTTVTSTRGKAVRSTRLRLFVVPPAAPDPADAGESADAAVAPVEVPAGWVPVPG